VEGRLGTPAQRISPATEISSWIQTLRAQDYRDDPAVAGNTSRPKRLKKSRQRNLILCSWNEDQLSHDRSTGKSLSAGAQSSTKAEEKPGKTTAWEPSWWSCNNPPKAGQI